MDFYEVLNRRRYAYLFYISAWFSPKTYIFLQAPFGGQSAIWLVSLSLINYTVFSAYKPGNRIDWLATVGDHQRLLAIKNDCWLSLFTVGYPYLLLTIPIYGWLSLQLTILTYCWLSLLSVGYPYFLLAIPTFCWLSLLSVGQSYLLLVNPTYC